MFKLNIFQLSANDKPTFLKLLSSGINKKGA